MLIRQKNHSVLYMEISLAFKMLVILGPGWLDGLWHARKRQPLEASKSVFGTSWNTWISGWFHTKYEYLGISFLQGFWASGSNVLLVTYEQLHLQPLVTLGKKKVFLFWKPLRTWISTVLFVSNVPTCLKVCDKTARWSRIMLVLPLQQKGVQHLHEKINSPAGR